MAVEVIEVEIEVTTKGGDKIKETKNLVKTTVGAFENLNEAISKTQDELGKLDPKSKKFKDAAKDLSQLKDRLRETEAQSLRFTEALAKQPGVIGLVGQSLEGLRGTMKVFMANPIIAVVAAIAGVFLALKESLTKTSEGQETLNRISGAFGKIIGPVMAIVEKVALPIFEKLADLLELVASGFNRFAKFLGISSEKIEEASRNSSEVLKEAYEEEEKRQEDETKKLEDENEKRADERKKAAEEALKQKLEDIKTANTILLEAELSLLGDRDRELKEREIRFNQEVAALKKAGFTDFTKLEEEYRLDVKNINDSYAADGIQQEKDRLQSIKDILQDYATETENILADTNVKIVDLEEQRALAELDALKATEEEKQKIREFYSERRKEAEKEDAKELTEFLIENKQFETDALQFIQDAQIANIQGVGNILSQVAGKNKKLAIAGVVLEQGAAIAKVVIDTARAISSASAAAAPFIANPLTAIPATANLARVIAQQKIAAGVSIAGIVAGAAKGISQISQAKIEGGGSAGGAGGGAGGGIASFAAPTAISAPQIQSTTPGATPESQIAATIGKSQERPMRAYVVSQDISSNQALDRRTSAAATFGG